MARIDERTLIRLLKRVRRLERRRVDLFIPNEATRFDVEDAIFPPVVKAWPAGDITLTNNVFGVITASQEVFDTDSMHDTTVNTSRLTANTPGVYWCHAQGEFNGNATGDRYLDILFNGATVQARTRISAVNLSIKRLHVQALVNLDIDDYVEFRAWQNSGGGLTLLGADSTETYFEAVRVALLP